MEAFAVWTAFILLILGLLALDLGVFHRKEHAIRLREALGWTGFWITLALVFNGLVYFLYQYRWFGVGKVVGHAQPGADAALEFLAAYLVEKSLSLDNIFVIALIFSYFSVAPAHQHRVLFWGIVGALLMRGLMIGAGAALIARFEWITFVFGGLLLLTALRLMVWSENEVHPDRNPLVRLTRRLVPVSNDTESGHFTTKIDGKFAITTLFLVLIVIESTDLLFAVDSIPAVFAVTRDPFIVFTSNVFAILGLRALYFVLAGAVQQFRYLRMSLVVLLGYVGVKMIIAHWVKIPTGVSLAVIGGVLIAGIAASIAAQRWSERVESDEEEERRWSRVLGYVRAHTRKVLIFIAGGTVVLVGVALIFLPGPGSLVIPAGLAILAIEFTWARALLDTAKRRIRGIRRVFKRGSAPEPPPAGAVQEK